MSSFWPPIFQYRNTISRWQACELVQSALGVSVVESWFQYLEHRLHVGTSLSYFFLLDLYWSQVRAVISEEFRESTESWVFVVVDVESWFMGTEMAHRLIRV